MDEPLPAPPLDLPEQFTPETCRAAVIRRVRWYTAAFDRFRRIPVAERAEHRNLYDDICHVRQDAAVLAALAGVPQPVVLTLTGDTDAMDGTEQGATA